MRMPEDAAVTWDELVARARGLAAHHRAILGIAGPPGAGKTTLAERLTDRLRAAPPEGVDGRRWVVHVPMDGFHLADVELERLGLPDRKGAAETFDVGGYLAMLRRFKLERDSVIYAPGFERILEQPIAASIAIPPATRLLVTEGNYLLLKQEPWPLVRAELAEVWYVDLDDTERVRRLIARHVQFGKSPGAAAEWVHRSDEANARLVRESRDGADLVVRLDAQQSGTSSSP